MLLAEAIFSGGVSREKSANLRAAHYRRRARSEAQNYEIRSGYPLQPHEVLAARGTRQNGCPSAALICGKSLGLHRSAFAPRPVSLTLTPAPPPAVCTCTCSMHLHRQSFQILTYFCLHHARRPPTIEASGAVSPIVVEFPVKVAGGRSRRRTPALGCSPSIMALHISRTVRCRPAARLLPIQGNHAWDRSHCTGPDPRLLAGGHRNLD